ncbi:DUF563 domain-containing protein [Paenibacillus sp. J31TS4]|uniref:glycosyltransferase family 61 protein n=1 Tax=Paenibacillus sp. J31TS4 TaxID=2807195 RepID=UPI001BCBC952|nr:glycosyltransferase 61 family protein [Paenibacillus sp. J31TS4]
MKRYYWETEDDAEASGQESKGGQPAPPVCFQTPSHTQPPGFTAVVKEGRIYGKNGAVLTSDHRLMGDMSWDWDPVKGLVYGSAHPLLKEWIPYPLERFDGTAANLAFVFSANYFHWMFDVLPRLYLIRRNGIRIDRYIVNQDGLAFQQETLDHLGIEPEMRIHTHDRLHLCAKRLVTTTPPMAIGYPGWACRFLRNAFLTDQDHSLINDQKLYVTRSRAGHRRLANEEAIRRVLTERGFQTVSLEGMPFKEQIGMFALAKCIVSCHGAGLTNLVFCRPDTKVIELFPRNFVKRYFWNISRQVGLDYHYLIGSEMNALTEFSVEEERLRLLLQTIGQ